MRNLKCVFICSIVLLLQGCSIHMKLEVSTEEAVFAESTDTRRSGPSPSLVEKQAKPKAVPLPAMEIRPGVEESLPPAETGEVVEPTETKEQ